MVIRTLTGLSLALGQVQRRLAFVIALVGVSFVSEQQRCELWLVVLHCYVERGCAFVILGVDCRTRFEKQFGDCLVAGSRRRV